MADAPQPASASDLLALFSDSVRRVASRLDGSPVSAWRIVHELLTDHDDYGGAELLPLADRSGAERPPSEWLTLLAGLFDRPAVARTPSKVIDGRLTLLGLTRIDDGLAALLRSTGLRWTLERDLGFPLDAVLVPWARPAARTQVVEYAVNKHPGGEACAFSPDGRFLATAGQDGVLRIWEVATSALVEELKAADALSSCEFSRDSSLVAAAHTDGSLRVWERDGLLELPGSPGHVPGLAAHALSPDGRRLATTTVEGEVQLHDVALADTVVSLEAHRGAARDCAFSPDGLVLASAGTDGACILSDVRAGAPRVILPGQQPLQRCGFSPDRPLLATLSESGPIVLWRMPQGDRLAELPREGNDFLAFAFSPDGRLLAAANAGFTRIWDVAEAAGPRPLVLERPRVAGGETEVLAFSPDGRLLATHDEFGDTWLWDVASGGERARVELGDGAARALAFCPDGGVFATVSRGGSVQLWEEIAPPGLLPAVVPDSTQGPDVLGAAADADALANLIAASATQPPLSIGLFGDWGSGKTFLIKQVQERVRRLARRSQQVPGSAYCAYVRNVEFNAWHYADANLWASLVTHLFDELAKPERAAGVDDERQARQQLARLEEELAAQSELRIRLERAQLYAQRTEARKQLLALTSSLAGLEGDASLATARKQLTGGLSWVKLAVPTRKLGVLVTGGAATVGGVTAALLWGLDVGTLSQAVASAGAFLGCATAAAKLASRRITELVTTVGETTPVADVRTDAIDAELEAARARESELREELADLAAGRRLARFAAERRDSADYRAHLGLVWRIYQDFQRMSEILEGQTRRERETAAAPSPPLAPAPPEPGRLRRVWRRVRRLFPGEASAPPPVADASVAPAPEQDGRTELPRIERIVLYIDDLDRCPPTRVVEVLEAVHLILALKLFVVVLAVDPRWLTQSLELHYSQLLGGEAEVGPDDETSQRAAALPSLAPDQKREQSKPDEHDDDEARLSTPINYLEKIIQIPFALRPMGQAGGAALVKSLLPVKLDDAEHAGPADPGVGATPTRTLPPPPHARRPERPLHAPAPRAGQGAPSLSPRTIALTPAERDFAAYVAPILRTPRAVKKFTNLYRLLRAGLDEASGELDRFLHDDTRNVSEFQASLILLAVVIAFPEEASDFLLGIGDLALDAPADNRRWSDYLDQDEHPPRLQAFVAAATEHAANGATSTREPFRRLALGVSRYSFDTGQKVFARHYAQAPL